MTDENQKDGQRALKAAKAIFDGRKVHDRGAICVTLEYTIALVLIAVIGDSKKAAGMLNEGILQGVEERLTWHEKRTKK